VVELVTENRAFGPGTRWESPDDDAGAWLDAVEALRHQVSQSALHTVAHDGVAHGFRYDETHQGAGHWWVVEAEQVHDEGGVPTSHTTAHREREVASLTHPVRRAQHGSGRELRAPLATTSREDRAAGAGTHTETEAVHLGTTPVVRLKSPLGHG